MRSYLIRLACLLALLGAGRAEASHLYGADFFYEYVSGNTYKISLVLYGDCAGMQFPNGFNGATPLITLSNGGTVVSNFNLSRVGFGVEVTPVCAAEKSNTACVNPANPIPGIMRYTYSAYFSLPWPYTSSSWVFRFEGTMGAGIAQAGRSNSITNLPSGSGSLMTLEASLNNTGGPNSSPQFTTIPTPFYCANIAQQYNQGAVDPNGDALSYSLADGLVPSGTVTYVSGYSGANPLATTTGSFSFSTATGQLNFTPSGIQKSLVVNKVEEYRNGTLVGSSMREMTFVVLPNCNNTPSTGAIDTSAATSTFGGVPASTSIFNVCQGADSIRFHILATNPSNDTIYASVVGLPAGATATILYDSTTHPDIIINWKTSSIGVGSYNFFVTYKDNGCPLSSTQTQAYTMQVIRPNEMATTILAPTQCVHQAYVSYNFSYGLLPRNISITQGTNVVHSYIDSIGSLRDSLAAGLYTVKITSPKLACPTTYQLHIVDSGVYPHTPITAPVFYCFGDAARLLTAVFDSGAYLNWYNASGTPLPGAPLPRTDTAGIFKYYTDQRFKVCTSLRDSLLVYVTRRPVASIAGPSSLCRGDTGVYVFNGTIGEGPILEYIWDWDMANYASGLNGGPYYVHWNTAGIKTITLQVAENKCASAVTTKEVEVKPSPYAGFHYPHEVCQYDTARVYYNTQPYPNQVYAWSFDGAEIAVDNGPKEYTLRWATAGLKEVSLAVDLDGCRDTQRAEITVHPVPTIRITNLPGPVCIGDKIFVEAVSDGTVKWSAADLMLYAADGRPYYQILQPSVYKAYATSMYGCVDSASVAFNDVQPCCQFSYPNAFTPANKGRNDHFHIVTYGNQIEFELSIYNRWGQRVYYGLDPAQGWDGTMNNDGGTPCDAGTYFYYLKAKCYTGHVEERKGDVLLIR